MKREYRWFLVLALGLASMIAVGCGGGGEADQTDSAGEPAADGTTDEPDTASTDGDSPDAAPLGTSSEQADGDEEPVDFSTAEAIGMTLRWRVVADELEVELSAPTRGWLAVGFRPTRAMRDANLLIGYVAGDEVVITDQFGTSMTSHREDEEIGGTRDVTIISGSETDAGTTLRFRIPLDSGDEHDRALVAGETIPAILAYGPDSADDTRTYHASRAAIEITL